MLPLNASHFSDQASPKANLSPILKLSLVAGFQRCILNISPLIPTFHLAFFISFAHFALYLLECHLVPYWNLQMSQRPSLSCLHSFILSWGRVKFHPLTWFQHPSVYRYFSDHLSPALSPSVIKFITWSDSSVRSLDSILTSLFWLKPQARSRLCSISESLVVDNVPSYLTVAMSLRLWLFCWHHCANSY